MYLRFSCRMIVDVLKSESLAKIAIPWNEDIPPYKESVGRIYPLLPLPNVWSTMDGPKMYLQQSGNKIPRSRLVFTTGGRMVTT